jgi:hypothetical protein
MEGRPVIGKNKLYPVDDEEKRTWLWFRQKKASELGMMQLSISFTCSPFGRSRKI